MRSISTFLCLTLLILLSGTQLFASQASRLALGDPSMVLEEESTLSTILNYGNPAGLTLLSDKNRIDLSASTSYLIGREKFVTGRPIIMDYSNTANPIAIPIEHITPNGTTLPANTLYVKDSYGIKSKLNIHDDYYLSGYIFRPAEQLIVQLDPLAHYQRSAPDEDLAPFRSLSGGLRVNSAYQLSDRFSIGAGVSYQLGQIDGWSQTTISSLLDRALINQSTDETQLFAQIGFFNSLNDLFSKHDQLDWGIHIKAKQHVNQGDYTFDQSSQPGLTEDPTAHVTYETLPWSAALQSIFHYKKVMDIGFEIGYEQSKDQVEWSSTYFNDQSSFGYATHYNVFYELDFRARLPMVREDDLRFGVSFTNKGIGNTYPTGKLLQDLPGTIANVPEINTTSSSIAIETAAVPIDGSLFAFKYHLGSSNSYQSGGFIEDVGFTDFTFSSQYKFWDRLLVRFSYSNIRLATELNPTKLVFVEETGTFRLGLGYTAENFDIDLYTGVYRKLYQPVTNTSSADVWERGLEGMLSFVYHF